MTTVMDFDDLARLKEIYNNSQYKLVKILSTLYITLDAKKLYGLSPQITQLLAPHVKEGTVVIKIVNEGEGRDYVGYIISIPLGTIPDMMEEIAQCGIIVKDHELPQLIDAASTISTSIDGDK